MGKKNSAEDIYEVLWKHGLVNGTGTGAATAAPAQTLSGQTRTNTGNYVKTGNKAQTGTGTVDSKRIVDVLQRHGLLTTEADRVSGLATQYARMYGPSQVNQFANDLATDAASSYNSGDIASINWDDMIEMKKFEAMLARKMRDTGMFDNELYALNSMYGFLPQTSYLESLLGQRNASLAESLKKDEADKAAKTRALTTWQNWSDMQNRLGELNEDTAPYFYAYADYLMNGDLSKPFSIDSYDAAWGEMDDDAYFADIDAKKAQFDALDWKTLTTKGAWENDYESATAGLRSDVDKLQKEIDRRKALAEMEAMLRSNPDFDALSAYQDTYTAAEGAARIFGNDAFIQGLDDQQRFINAQTKYADRQLAGEYSGKVKQYLSMGLDMMTPAEIANYNVALSMGPEQAEAYLELLAPELNARRAEVQANYYTTRAGDTLAGAIDSAGTIITKPQGTFNTIWGAISGEYDPNASIYDISRNAGITRSEYGEHLGKLAPFQIFGEEAGTVAYNIIMSIGDMLMARGIGGMVGGLSNKAGVAQKVMGWTMASQSGADTYLSDLQNGKDPLYAAMHGIANGAVEMWSESGFIDSLFDDSGKFLTRVAKSATSEGLEEWVSEGGQMAVDLFLSYMAGQENEIQQTYKYYEQTLGKGNAAAATLEHYANNFAIAGLSGFVSGGGTSFVTNTATEINNRQVGNEVVQQGDPERILEIAKQMDPSSNVYQIATEIETSTEKGKKMSLGKLGRLTQALDETLRQQYADLTNGVMNDAITERLIELGSDPEAARRNADAIRKIGYGLKVTVQERAGLIWDKYADQVAREVAQGMHTVTKGVNNLRKGVENVKQGVRDAVGGFFNQMENSKAVDENIWSDEQIGGQTGDSILDSQWVDRARVEQFKKSENVAKQSRDFQQALTSRKNVSTAVQEAKKNAAGKVRKGKDGKAVGKETSFHIAYDNGSGVTGEGDLEHIERTEDGKLQMVIKNGDEKVNVDIGSFTQADGEGTATLLESIKYINDNLHPVSAEEANAMLQSYKAAGGDAGRFVESYETLYLWGYSDVANDTNLPATDLDGTLAKIAVESGRRQAEADEQQRKTRASSYKALENPKAGWLGKVNSRNQLKGLGDVDGLEAHLQALPESQRVAAEIVIESGKALGLNVVMYDSQGEGMADLPNGAFDELTHTVYYDVSAGAITTKDVQSMKEKGTLGYALMRVGGHELTHYLEVGSPEMYAKYKRAVLDALKANGKDPAVLIRKRIDKALSEGKKLTYNAAVAEVIADASEYMLRNSKFTNNLDSTLKGKIKEFIQNFSKKIREIFAHLTGGHEESEALMETVNGVKKYMKDLQNLWDAGFEEILAKGTEDLSGETAEAVERQELKNAERDRYDYSKPFAQQVDDYKNGNFPTGDSLHVGRTPELYRQIGLGDLPMTINQTHVDYIVNGTKDADHYMGEAWLKKLPQMLQNPVAVIRSDTDAENSVVVILAEKINGKQIIAPVYVNGVSTNNSLRIDSNNIATAFGKGNALTKMLTDALNAEASAGNDVGVYYWNKTEAHNLYRSAGLQLPGSSVQDGLIHSIFDAGSPVNSKMLQRQTDSYQFRRWFGNSQVVNEDGTPKVMYHGTTRGGFTVFDGGKDYYYFTDNKKYAYAFAGRKANGQYYPAVKEAEAEGRKKSQVYKVYLSVQNPYITDDVDIIEDALYWDKNLAQNLRDKGYDALMLPDMSQVIVLNQSQIKSATDNVGTFDPGNPDIRYSDRDLPADITVRDYLAEMEPTDRMNETEKILLKRYKETLGKLQEAEKNATEQNEILKTATGDELIKAKNRWQIYRKQADRYARELARAERAEGFAGMLATGQKLVDQYLTGGYTRIADASDELEAEIKGIEKKLKVIGATLQGAEQAQKNAHARGLFNQTELNDAAKQLKDSYASRMSVKEIANRLALAYGEIYADNGAEGAKRFADAAKELAQDIVYSSKYRYRSETLSLIAEEVPVISLTETDKQEIKNAGLTISQYKRGIAPFVKVAEGASDLSSYVSNAEAYGGQIGNILGTDTEGNLAMALYNVIQAERTSEQAGTFEGMTEGESISAVMVDIMSANLPMTTDSATLDYLRKEMLKQAGESKAAAQTVEGAIQSAKTATKKASTLWHRAVQEVQLSEDAIEYYRALDEQRRLMELAEQKKALTEQLKSDAAKKIHEQVEKQRTEYREREQRAREYRKTREGVEKLRRGIGRKVKRLNTLRVRETDQKHVPQELQHVADMVMQTFTDSSLGRLAFPEAKMNSLARTYRELRLLESDATYYWDDEIEADITNLQALGEAYSALKNREGSVPSMYSLEGVELETEILQGVDAIVSNVMQMIDSTNDAFLTQRSETFSEFANKTGEKLRTHDDHKVYKGWRGKLQNMLDELIVKGNMTPIYFFEHLQNQEMLDVFNELREGQNLYAQIVAEGKAFMESTRAKHNYGAWVNDGKLTMKTGQGHTIELTREEAAEIYAIAKREAANKLYQTEHLLYGGFQYKNIAEKLNEDGKTQQKNTPHQLDKADISRIGEWLTAEQKAYADELVGFLSTTMADYGNQASMDMYGYKKFTEQYYIPFHTSAEQRFLKGDEGPQGENAGTGRVKNSGFTKKLQHKANQTLLVGGISDTVADHIHKMAAYAAMVQPIENMKRLMNHQVLENDGTSNTIRALIGQKYGQAAQDYLMQLLKDANGATMSDHRASGLTDKLVGAFKRGAVMASASVVLQQPTAMARAMAYINPKHFANNPFYRPSKGTWDELMKYSGTAVIKDMGKFDVGMGLTATQYINDDTLPLFKTFQELFHGRKTGKEAYDRFMAWLTAAPGVADQWTWGLIWKAVKAEQAELHPEMDKSSEAFLNLCGARFDDVIDHTQVYDSVLTRSNLMRGQDFLSKSLTAFKSEPTLSLNMLYDAVMGKHTGKQRGAIIGGVIASQVLAGALAALVQAWNDDDDERNWLEKYADRATGNVLDNLNPLKMIPGVSDIISLCEGYDVARQDMEVAADVINYGKNFFSKAMDPDKTLGLRDYENFVGTLANLLGFPAKNLLREVRRTWNMITNTDWSAPDAFGVGQAVMGNLPGYSVNKTTYYQRITTALIRGETQLAEDYKAYMLASQGVDEDKLTQGIRTAYKEAYEKGGIDKDTAIAFLLENNLVTGDTEEKRKQSAFQYVDKWEEGTDGYSPYNTLKDAYAAINFSEIEKAWKELTNNGYTDKQVKEQSRTLLKKLVQDGSITTGQATQLLKKWCPYAKESDNTNKPKEWASGK